MIDHKCPRCKTAMSSLQSLAGKTDPCPECRHPVTVPLKPPPVIIPEPTYEARVIKLLQKLVSEIGWITIWIKLVVLAFLLSFVIHVITESVDCSPNKYRPTTDTNDVNDANWEYLSN